MTAAVPGTAHLLAGLGLMFLVTLALRAAPFLALTALFAVLAVDAWRPRETCRRR